jgi:hypothetical protein
MNNSIINIFDFNNKSDIKKGKKREKWYNEDIFSSKIISIQKFLNHKSQYEKLKQCKDCLLCNKKCISKKKYSLYNFSWDDGIIHYITEHHLKPPDNFTEKIFRYTIKSKDYPIFLKGIISNKYVKINRNQLLILDALMEHGGTTKKYVDINDKKVYHFSEHSGLLDFGTYGLNKIIVAGNTTRIDRGDEEIYLPKELPEMFEYEYIFHTHPPTPKPGGRAEYGIIYELPSLSDMLHFVEHSNEGKTIGSIVMTPEGLYNIRKFDQSKKKFKFNENNFFKNIRSTLRIIKNKSLVKYGTKFSTNAFYSKIAQDTSFINTLNNSLKKYNLIIDYFPRIKDGNQWIVDSIYLQI